MNALRALAWVLALLAAAPAGAHRLDEYLQATTLAVEKGRVRVEIRLAPGVAVFPTVFAGIDSDADGVASAAEQQAYARRVLDDLSLSADGRSLPLRLVSSAFAPKELLQQGLGEIQLRLEADLPGPAARRRLAFENRHQNQLGTYLVNALVPGDPGIRIAGQERSYDQSSYQLDYTDAGAPAAMLSFAALSGPWGWIDGALVAFLAGLALLIRRNLPPAATRRGCRRPAQRVKELRS
jgi:hypothetical protein